MQSTKRHMSGFNKDNNKQTRPISSDTFHPLLYQLHAYYISAALKLPGLSPSLVLLLPEALLSSFECT